MTKDKTQISQENFGSWNLVLGSSFPLVLAI